MQWIFKVSPPVISHSCGMQGLGSSCPAADVTVSESKSCWCRETFSLGALLTELCCPLKSVAVGCFAGIGKCGANKNRKQGSSGWTNASSSYPGSGLSRSTAPRDITSLCWLQRGCGIFYKSEAGLAHFFALLSRFAILKQPLSLTLNGRYLHNASRLPSWTSPVYNSTRQPLSTTCPRRPLQISRLPPPVSAPP